MAGNARIREYYGYLFLTAAMAAGAVLANNFVPLVFFWEGLLITLYAMITIGGKANSHRTAVKSFLIGGFCDFCMILGIAILWSQTGTLRMSDISVVPQGLTARQLLPDDDRRHRQGRLHALPHLDPRRRHRRPGRRDGLRPGRPGKTAGHLPAGAHLPRFLQAGGQQPVQPGADDRRRPDHRAGRVHGPDPEGPEKTALLPRRLPGRLHDAGHRHRRAHRHRRRHFPHDQPRHVQERLVPGRRFGGAADRDHRAEKTRRPVPGSCR